MGILVSHNPDLPEGALRFVMWMRGSSGSSTVFVNVSRAGLSSFGGETANCWRSWRPWNFGRRRRKIPKFSTGTGSGAPETELYQEAPSAHPTQNWTATTSGPVTAAVTHGPESLTNPASGCPSHGESDCKGKNEQFNIDFIQINLNKSKSATGDLALFTENKEKPILGQLWPKESFTTDTVQ